MNRFKEVRLQRKLSQEKLAELAECSQQAIADYEKGKVVPGGGALTRLSAVLGFRSAYLLGESDNPKREDHLPQEWEQVADDLMAMGLSPSDVRQAVRSWQVARGLEVEVPGRDG